MAKLPVTKARITYKVSNLHALTIGMRVADGFLHDAFRASARNELHGLPAGN